MENAGGGIGGGGVGNHDQSMLSQNNSDLDNLSNLLINSYEDDAAILDQYELDLEKNLQESLIMEKEQHNQRLFQSFQTSACAVAQMFKDKSSAQQQSVLSSWESFQNSAGAITVLYKDSLEACRVHMDLGIHLGQQRKLKDLINWIKKKKKRSIRKDELISFLIGKQYPSQQNQMFNLFRPSQQSSTHPNPFNANLGHMIQSQQSNSMNSRAHRNQHQRQRSTLVSTNSSTNANSMANNVNNTSSGGAGATNIPLIASNPALNLLNNGENSNGSEVDNTSDLATFREALIMHNRSRDTPLNRNHPTSHNHAHTHHHHHHQPNNNNNPSANNHTHLHPTTNQNPANNQTDSAAAQQQQPVNGPPNCDDLDCFFCEQIATHIEHKRSSANLNFDADSPTRKRSRFY